MLKLDVVRACFIYVFTNECWKINYLQFSFKNWGPKNNRRYEEWIKFKAEKIQERDLAGDSWLKQKMWFLLGK